MGGGFGCTFGHLLCVLECFSSSGAASLLNTEARLLPVKEATRLSEEVGGGRRSEAAGRTHASFQGLPESL